MRTLRATLVGLYAVYEVVRGQGHPNLAAARSHTYWVVGIERHLHVFGERAVQQAVEAVPTLPTPFGLAYIFLHSSAPQAFWCGSFGSTTSISHAFATS